MERVKKGFQHSPNFQGDNLSLRNSIAGSVASASVTLQNPFPIPQNVHIGVRCPTTGIENIFVVKSTDSVGHLRRHSILQSFLKVKEALNFGLYLPPQGSKKGKFLEEERPISDYPVLLQGGGRRSRDADDATSTSANTLINGMQNSPDSGVGQDPCWLELIFKARMDSENSSHQSRIRKLKTKVTQNFFMDMVRNKDVKDIENLLNKGFDPNFWSRKDGEAPITAAATTFNPRNVIIALVNGGAHIDFRARDSHTALHRAAICGNYEAIQTLLDLGQNPNCRDDQGLTPLYHAVSTEVSARCTQALLFDHAIIGVEDENGFQEIHQACKANRLQHLENLIVYGADLNARTRRGQTPLHLCVWYEADACLRQLLLRGADPTQVNEDNQTPLEFALLTNHNEQAAILQNFDPNDVVPIRETPSYNTSRRPVVNGPRGAVTYNMLHKSPLPCSDYTSTCLNTLSPPESLFSTERLPISNFGSTTPSASLTNQNGLPDDVVTNTTQIPYLHSIEDYTRTLGGTPGVKRATFGDEKKHNSSPSKRSFSHERNQEKLYTRIVAMRRGRDGFGFTLNGVPRKAIQHYGQQLPSNTPSNQYFSFVVPEGPADRAGVKEGDYVIEIDGQDVTDACHEEVVECITNCGDSLIMRVTSVLRGSTPHQMNGISNSRQTPQTRKQLQISKEMHEIAEMNRLSSNGSDSDEEIDCSPKVLGSVSRNPSAFVSLNSRGRIPLAVEERSRSRDRRSRVTKYRTQSLGRQLWLNSTSPANKTKEKVFVFEKIDGKTRAVPLEEAKTKNQVQPDRSIVQFAGDRSPSPPMNRRSCSSNSVALLVSEEPFSSARHDMISDVETTSHSNPKAVNVIADCSSSEDEKPSTTHLYDNETPFQNTPCSTIRPYQSCLSISPLKRTDQDTEISFIKNLSCQDDQSTAQRLTAQKRLPRMYITRSMPRLDQI